MYSKTNLYMIKILKLITLTVLTSFIIVSPIYSQTAEDYNNSGVGKFESGDYKGAIADYSKAIELNPNFAAYHNRGTAKHSLKDYKGAIADYSKAIELNPKLAEAYAARGLAKIGLGQKDGGCLDLSKTGEMGYAEAYDLIKKYCN